MTLAEALALRSDLYRRMTEAKARIVRNAKVQEGDEPAEDPEELIREYEELAREFESLVTKINLTNASTDVEGQVLTSLLAARDVLKLKTDMYREAVKAASIVQTRATKSEVRFKSALSVKSAQTNADANSKKLRELDTRIQKANWMTELSD